MTTLKISRVRISVEQQHLHQYVGIQYVKVKRAPSAFMSNLSPDEKITRAHLIIDNYLPNFYDTTVYKMILFRTSRYLLSILPLHNLNG